TIMSMSTSMSLADRLRQLLGGDAVSHDPDTLAAHSSDKWFAAHEPDVVVFARSTNDISKLLQFASREKVPVTARGGGFGNAGGPHCLKYSVTRNYVIGLEVVLATGEVLRTGGRVHKNKTGFDLIGLFIGSEGMLGMVTEIILRLLPLPPARATLSAASATAAQAAEAVQAIFAAGFLPSSLEIADHFTLEAARRDLRKMIVPEGNAHLLVDLDGQEESVRAESAAIQELLLKRKPNALELAIGEADCDTLWALRRQFSN